MKKIIKSNLVGFILGGIIFGSLGVFAASYIATDVSYTPTDSDWKVSNVNDALNSLYKYYKSDDVSSVEPLILSGSYIINGEASSGGYSRRMNINTSGIIFTAEYPMYNSLKINSKSNCEVTFNDHILTITTTASASTSQNSVADGTIYTSSMVEYNITLS